MTPDTSHFGEMSLTTFNDPAFRIHMACLLPTHTIHPNRSCGTSKAQACKHVPPGFCFPVFQPGLFVSCPVLWLDKDGRSTTIVPHDDRYRSQNMVGVKGEAYHSKRDWILVNSNHGHGTRRANFTTERINDAPTITRFPREQAKLHAAGRREAGRMRHDAKAGSQVKHAQRRRDPLTNKHYQALAMHFPGTYAGRRAFRPEARSEGQRVSGPNISSNILRTPRQPSGMSSRQPPRRTPARKLSTGRSIPPFHAHSSRTWAEDF